MNNNKFTKGEISILKEKVKVIPGYQKMLAHACGVTVSYVDKVVNSRNGIYNHYIITEMAKLASSVDADIKSIKKVIKSIKNDTDSSEQSK